MALGVLYIGQWQTQEGQHSAISFDSRALLLVSFLTSALWAQADRMDLKDLLTEALNHNPEIAAAQKRYEASRQQPTQVSSLADPIISPEHTGIVIDTMSGAKHTMGITPDDKCVRECVKMDAKKTKYALLVGKDIYVLSDQQTPEKFAARKVTVTGTLFEKTKVLKVDSIEAAVSSSGHSGHSR